MSSSEINSRITLLVNIQTKISRIAVRWRVATPRILLSLALITCCSFWLAVLVGVFVACGQNKDSADGKMQKELSGTWMFEARFERGSNAEHTMTVAPDGSYALTVTFPSRTNGPRTIHFKGIFRVEGGFLIDTVTKDSQTNALVPSTNRSRIVRITGRELVLDYERLPGVVHPTNPIVFLKQGELTKSPEALR
jgi:hypothetical protein